MSEDRQGALKIFDAILSINPNARVVVRGGDIDTCEIEWHNGTAEISKADIKKEMDKLWNLAIVILKNKSVIVENDKAIFYWSSSCNNINFFS